MFEKVVNKMSTGGVHSGRGSKGGKSIYLGGVHSGRGGRKLHLGGVHSGRGGRTINPDSLIYDGNINCNKRVGFMN